MGLDKKDAQVAELYEERNGLANQVLTLKNGQERLIEEMEIIKRKSIEAVEESSTNNDVVMTLKEKNVELEKLSETLHKTITSLQDKAEEAEEVGRLSASNIATLRADLHSKLEEIKGSDTELKGVINEVQSLREELAKMCLETKGKSNDSDQLIDVDEDDHHTVNAVKVSVIPATLAVSAGGNSQILVLYNDIQSMKDQMRKTSRTFISKIKSQTTQVMLSVGLLSCSVSVYCIITLIMSFLGQIYL